MLLATLCYTFDVTLFTTLFNCTFLHFCALSLYTFGATCLLPFTTLFVRFFIMLFCYTFVTLLVLHFFASLCYTLVHFFATLFATLCYNFVQQFFTKFCYTFGSLFTTPFTTLLVLYLFATLCTASGTGIYTLLVHFLLVVQFVQQFCTFVLHKFVSILLYHSTHFATLTGLAIVVYLKMVQFLQSVQICTDL